MLYNVYWKDTLMWGRFGCSLSAGDVLKEVARCCALLVLLFLLSRKRKKAGRQMAPQVAPAGCASRVGGTGPPLDYSSQHAQRAQLGAALVPWPQCMLGAAVPRLVIGRAAPFAPRRPSGAPRAPPFLLRLKMAAEVDFGDRELFEQLEGEDGPPPPRLNADEEEEDREEAFSELRERLRGCEETVRRLREENILTDWRGLRRAGTGGCLPPPDPFRARLCALRCSRAAREAGRGAAGL